MIKHRFWNHMLLLATALFIGDIAFFGMTGMTYFDTGSNSVAVRVVLTACFWVAYIVRMRNDRAERAEDKANFERKRAEELSAAVFKWEQKYEDDMKQHAPEFWAKTHPFSATSHRYQFGATNPRAYWPGRQSQLQNYFGRIDQ